MTPSELKYFAQVHRVDQIFQTLRAFFRYLAICFGCAMVYLSLKEMAGKSTDFRAVIDWAVKADVTKWAAYVIALIFGSAWWFERKRYRKLTRQAGPRLSHLEQQINPARTSSGLNRDGTLPRGTEHE